MSSTFNEPVQRAGEPVERAARDAHEADGVVDDLDRARLARRRALDERVELAAVAVGHRTARSFCSAPHRPRGHAHVRVVVCVEINH